MGQGFCPLKIKITGTQFPDGICLSNLSRHYVRIRL